MGLFLTNGFPSPEDTLPILEALDAGGPVRSDVLSDLDAAGMNDVAHERASLCLSRRDSCVSEGEWQP